MRKFYSNPETTLQNRYIYRHETYSKRETKLSKYIYETPEAFCGSFSKTRWGGRLSTEGVKRLKNWVPKELKFFLENGVEHQKRLKVPVLMGKSLIRYNKFRKLKVDKKRHGLQISGRIKS